MAKQRTGTTRQSMPALSLSSQRDDYIVTIDGDPYRLRLARELPLTSMRRYERLVGRFQELWQKDDLSTDEEVELSETLIQICVLILDAPREKVQALTDVDRFHIAKAFTELSRPSGAQAGATTGAPKKSRRG